MQDLIDRQAAIELVRDVCDAVMSGCESWYDPEIENEVYKDTREVDAILKCKKEVRIALRNMPSAQPDEKLEKCRFEYINACRIVTFPTPDTTKQDISDAYAVIKALQPIFGDVTF